MRSSDIPHGYAGLHEIWGRDSAEVLEVTKDCWHQIAIDALLKYNMARELLKEREDKNRQSGQVLQPMGEES